MRLPHWHCSSLSSARGARRWKRPLAATHAVLNRMSSRLVCVAVLMCIGCIGRAQLAVKARTWRAGAVTLMAGMCDAFELDRRVPDLVLLGEQRADAVQDGGAIAWWQVVNYCVAGECA